VWTNAVPREQIPKAKVVAGRNQPGPIFLHRIFRGISNMMYET
jgi:hypothetical protein